MTESERLGAARVDLGHPDLHEHTSRDGAPAAGPLLFIPFVVLFLVGLWLLGYGFDQDSGLLFCLGLLLAGVAFLVPLSLRD